MVVLERIKSLIDPKIHIVSHAGISPVEDVFPIVFPKQAECAGGSVKLEQMANYMVGQSSRRDPLIIIRVISRFEFQRSLLKFFWTPIFPISVWT